MNFCLFTSPYTNHGKGIGYGPHLQIWGEEDMLYEAQV